MIARLSAARALAAGCALLVWAIASDRPATAVVPEDSEPAQVRLSYTSDPATSITIRWTGPAEGAVRYRQTGSSAWSEVPAASIATRDGDDLQVVVVDLTPDTPYEYQLTDIGDTWTPTRSFRTAPIDGAFEVAFVADTGIAGRTDGLTTGTRQVIDEIAAEAPVLVLGGGDYAYYNSEDRFPDLGGAIDSWLEQMEPIIAESAFMPTYGNHEVLLGEDVDHWIERFSTPDGAAGRTSYSFNVAGVHFIALMAYESVVDDATEAWLTADLEAASGARAIVPYLHRNVYGDGTVHPPSPSLARQLSALFEAHGVQVVLTAHDQSYERTYPLSAGEPTSTSRHCYTPADGITWVKSSPGGKLSNVNWSFSDYDETPPNATIAVREGGLHHYTVLRVGDGDDLEVVTYGVTGNGEPPVVVDAVRYAETCPPELAFLTQPPLLDIDAGASDAVFDVELGGGPATLTSSVDWITTSAVDAVGRAQLTVEGGGLATGRHAAEIRAVSTDGRIAVLPVAVKVRGSNSAATLVVSASADRADPTVLDGAVLSGDVYVELAGNTENVGKVRFFLDGARERNDGGAPFDLVGGSRQEATGWSTAAIPDGEHLIEAIVVDADGAATFAVARFTVANDGSATGASSVSGRPFVPPPVVAEPSVSSPETDRATVATLPPVTFAPLTPVPEPAAQDPGWWTSWWSMIVGIALIGVVAAIIGLRSGTRGESRPRDADAAA